MEIFVRWYQFRSSVHATDISSEGNTVEVKMEKRRMYSQTKSFNKSPEEDFTEALNMARMLVVILDSLQTVCIGR